MTKKDHENAQKIAASYRKAIRKFIADFPKAYEESKKNGDPRPWLCSIELHAKRMDLEHKLTQRQLDEASLYCAAPHHFLQWIFRPAPVPINWKEQIESYNDYMSRDL